MRHQRSGKKLGRDSAHRKALYANLAGALIEHGRIQTTVTKAKAVKPIAEQMITLGRRGDLHARRQAMAFLRSKDVVHKLFDEVGPALRGAARRLLADRQARPAAGRRRRDGLPRARRHAARLRGRTPRTPAGRGAGDAAPRPSTRPRRRPTSRGGRRRGGRTRSARPTRGREPRRGRRRRAGRRSRAAAADEPRPTSPKDRAALGDRAERGADRHDHRPRERHGRERRDEAGAKNGPRSQASPTSSKPTTRSAVTSAAW